VRKIDRIMRELLFCYYEHGTRFFNQKKIASTCGLSLGTVNPVINQLEQIGSIERRPLGFRLIDPKRLLTYWAATRDLPKDITYTTFSPKKVSEIEEELRSFGLLTAFSGYRVTLGSVPVDYSQTFVYANPDVIRRAFRPTSRKKRNIFVLAPDDHLRKLGKAGVAPLVQVYVDLWQLGAPASRLVEELEREFARAPARAIEEAAQAVKLEG
jgi:biotin operon repressor